MYCVVDGALYFKNGKTKTCNTMLQFILIQCWGKLEAAFCQALFFKFGRTRTIKYRNCVNSLTSCI